MLILLNVTCYVYILGLARSVHTHTPTASVAGDVTNRESLISRPSIGDNISLISDSELVGGTIGFSGGGGFIGSNASPRYGQVMQFPPEPGHQPPVSTANNVATTAASHSTYVPVVHALNWGLAHCNETLMQGNP